MRNGQLRRKTNSVSFSCRHDGGMMGGRKNTEAGRRGAIPGRGSYIDVAARAA